MQWVSAGVVAVAALAWFWAPGLVILASAGVRGLNRWALAPLATVGVLGVGAILAGAVGLPWHPISALAVAGIAAGAAVVLTRRRGQPPPRPGARPGHLGAAIAAGAAAQVIAVAVGMGGPGRIPTAHDTITHVSGLAWVRSGHASALDFQRMEPLREGLGYYPSGWHAVAGLVPAWPDPVVVFNVATVVPVAVAWTVGLAAVTSMLMPARPRAVVLAAILAPAGMAMPVLLTMRPEGMVPNALATALLPAAVVAVAGQGPRRVTIPLAILGLGAAHPNAILTATVLLAPWLAPRLWRAVRRLWTSAPGRIVVLGGSVVTCVVVAGATTLDAWRVVVAARDSAATPPTSQALALLSGNATGLGSAGGALVVLLAVVGAILVLRLRARWWAWSALLVGAFYLAVTSAVPVLRELDRPWYGEAARYAPALALTAVPLAALALDSLPRWAVQTGRLTTTLRPSRVSAALAAVVVGASGLAGVVGLVQLSADTWVGSSERPVVADDAELAMMYRLRSELDEGAVLGSPFAGTAHLYPLAGLDPLPRSSLVDELPADLSDAVHNLDRLAEDPQVCAALERAGVRYVYVDDAPWNYQPGLPDIRHAPPGARLVDSGGTAAVYDLVGCR